MAAYVERTNARGQVIAIEHVTNERLARLGLHVCTMCGVITSHDDGYCTSCGHIVDVCAVARTIATIKAERATRAGGQA